MIGRFLQVDAASNVNETLCAIWYHFYNLKHVKNTHEGVLLLAKLIWYHLYNLKNVKSTHGRVLLLVACNFSMGIFHVF